MAPSNLQLTSNQAGAAAEKASSGKASKYSDLTRSYCFQAIAIETLGSWATEALHFVRELGRRLEVLSGEARATSFLIQTISMAIQPGNAASVIATHAQSESPDSYSA